MTYFAISQDLFKNQTFLNISLVDGEMVKTRTEELIGTQPTLQQGGYSRAKLMGNRKYTSKPILRVR